MKKGHMAKARNSLCSCYDYSKKNSVDSNFLHGMIKCIVFRTVLIYVENRNTKTKKRLFCKKILISNVTYTELQQILWT